MDWTQTLTIIGSVLVPTFAGFGWLIHLILDSRKESQKEKNQLSIEIKQLDLRLSQDIKQVDNRLREVDNRLSRIEGYLQGRDVHLSNTDKTS